MQQKEFVIRQGTKCHICTNCGRCFGGSEGMQVVTAQMMFSGEQNVRKMAGFLIATDIGTTTIAMILYDRDGVERDRFVTVNPQVRFGADVVSRIQAASEPESKAAQEMQKDVWRVLKTGIRHFGENVDLKNVRMVIAANTTMHYLLMGYNTKELGYVPFHASHLKKETFVLDGIEVTTFPGFSAFVGGDIVSGIYAGAISEGEEVTLLIDLGTNGEMAIGNCRGLTVCSTAAGPAFEGGASKGIWGADMVHLTARLLEEGILDETGLLADSYFDKGIRIGDVHITQQAVRSLQLAKAAIAAGIQLLAKAHGLTELAQIEKVILAGGFGYFLKAEDAVRIGLLPHILADKVVSGGNTALAGILRYGKEGSKAEKTIQDMIAKTQAINLAVQPGFQDRYIEAMYLEEW